MTRPNAWLPLPALWLILSLLPAQVLDAQPPAQYVVLELSLSAFAFRYSGPRVVSDAGAELYSRSTGGRIFYELILGHKVDDLTNSRLIFQSRSVSPNGSAQSSTGYLPGDLYACYTATVIAHVNAFNIHDAVTSDPPQCTEVVDIGPEPPPKEYCPILLDLELNGFHLSAPDPSVSFDIDADGALDQIAWTQAGADDAFLCLDRNHNGVIDDGRELFGFATPLLSGHRAKVGYRALAELDQAELGGNRDGKVDANDPMFRELCAWIDTNRDGLSQADEIHTLDQVGVATLKYDYANTRLRDSYGNLFRYVSRAEIRTPSGSLRAWPTYDVIFAEP